MHMGKRMIDDKKLLFQRLDEREKNLFTMPSQPSRQMFRKKINCHEVIREDTDVGDNLLPKSHLVASLLKRWLLGTYQGAVRPVHLDYYLDEYTFRFNRRTSRSRGKLFYRLLQQAAEVRPVTICKKFMGEKPARLRYTTNTGNTTYGKRLSQVHTQIL